MNRARATAITAALAYCATYPAQQARSKQQTPEQIDARIDALIAKITVAERIAQLQDRAPAIERLGLPSYNWWNQGRHGLARDRYATVFPQARRRNRRHNRRS